MSAGHPEETAQALLQRALRALPPRAPVAILVHGFRYNPDLPPSDPHRSILAPGATGCDPRYHAWPEGLGLGREGEGLAICLGWNASGPRTPAGLRAAYRRAGEAGAAVAEVLALVARLAPDRRIDAFGHSLGGRVILSALAGLAEGNVGRVLLVGAADFTASAEAALGNPAVAGAEFYNIRAPENAFYDSLVEWIVPRYGTGARALGRGLAPRRGHAALVDLPLGRAATRSVLARRGIHVAPPRRPVCHWSLYTRPGIFALYRAMLHDRGAWAAAPLAAEIAAAAAETRAARRHGSGPGALGLGAA